MSPNTTTSYAFYLDYNAGTGPTAASDLKQQCGEDGGMVVVPYFQVPPYGEYFDDAEGRFPMLEQMEAFLRGECYDDTTILCSRRSYRNKRAGRWSTSRLISVVME